MSSRRLWAFALAGLVTLPQLLRMTSTLFVASSSYCGTSLEQRFRRPAGCRAARQRGTKPAPKKTAAPAPSTVQPSAPPPTPGVVEAVEAQVWEPPPTPLKYVLPVGPAAPFRSDKMEFESLDLELSTLAEGCQAGSAEFAVLAGQAAAGEWPSDADMKRVGDILIEQGKKLDVILTKMETAQDFQALESYYALDIQSRKTGAPSIRMVQLLTMWQGESLLAMSEGLPELPPPAGIDLASLSNPASPYKERAIEREAPFTDDSFTLVGTPAALELKTSYERLIREHYHLVAIGAGYGNFDSQGKELYLNQMREIMIKWDELMMRADQNGIRPTRAYEAFSQEYLSRSSVSAPLYRNFVEEIYQVLREKARQ